MNNIWIFGCSFSSGYLEVDRENSYGNLLSKELNLGIKNLASAGDSNDIIFNKLVNNLKDIKENDIIIYQFTNFNRIGFFHNDEYTFSTAGIPELGVKHKVKENIFSSYSENDLNILLDFILTWQNKRRRFEIENALNLLEYIKITKNVNYIVIYMIDEYFKINDNTLILPFECNENNVSMNKFLIDKKLTLSDDFPENHKDFYDSHPGLSGHLVIKDKILDKLNKLNKKLI